MRSPSHSRTCAGTVGSSVYPVNNYVESSVFTTCRLDSVEQIDEGSGGIIVRPWRRLSEPSTNAS